RALAEHDAVLAAVHDRHDAASGIVLALEDGAEIMVGAQIRYPGQPARDLVAARDPPALEAHRLDAEKALHGIGQAGAAERAPGRDGRAERRTRRRVLGVPEIPAERGLAPHAERGREAQLARRGHGVDG